MIPQCRLTPDVLIGPSQTSDQRVRDHGRLRLSRQRNRACAVVLEANRTEAPIQPCPIQPFVID